MTKAERTTKELEKAIESLLIASSPYTKIEAHAYVLFEQQSDLIDLLTPDWQTREVMRMIRRQKAKLKSAEQMNEQYLLPGFEHLPKRIRTSSAKRAELANATYRQLREYLAVLHQQHRNDQRVSELKALIDLVQRHAKTTPGITVKEVCEREARK